MKYFLVLGIEYKFFKKPGNITIHVGDNFIDTFQLDRDFLTADILPQLESKWYEKLGKSYFLTPGHPMTIGWAKMPVLFKVYEIDDRAIEGKLKIKVENSHNDYTNGFMKNSSMIKFPIVALFKKELVRNRGEMMMKASIEFEMKWWGYKKKTRGDLLSWSCIWPSALSFYASREEEIYEKSDVRGAEWWIGGNFTAEFIIKTKHRTKYLALTKDTKFVGFPASGRPTNLLLASCSQLLNIYDEDQRSNRTKN